MHTYLPSRDTVKRSIITSLLSNAALQSVKLFLKVDVSNNVVSRVVGSQKAIYEAPVQIMAPSALENADVQLFVC